MNETEGKITSPLMVDMEVLVQTDLLWESFFLLLKRYPSILLQLPLWLIRGSEFTAQQITKRVVPDVEYLPYNEQFLENLREQHQNGQQLILVTSLPIEYAQHISGHLGLFDSVVSKEESLSLRHEEQAAFIEPDQTIAARDPATAAPVKGAFFEYIRAFRPHHWLKNILVFIPLITSHQIDNPQLILRTLLAFIAFSLCASGVYLLNDLLDIPADRRHPRKCKRPFAAASISIKTGTLLIPALTFTAFAIGLFLTMPFVYVLAVYLTCTVLYSIWLKKMVLIDVITLAFLYTIRILAGGAAVNIVPSFWLLSFSIFVFFSLALIKRSSELLQVQSLKQNKLDGRGYWIDDINIIQSFGIASGYMSVLVLALYINSDNVRLLYKHPQVIWLLCPLLLYWISRMWLITNRGTMHDDPLLFAIRDRTSHALAILGVVALWLAL